MEKLFQNIEALLKGKAPVTISIEGGAGSGKTTLANVLQEKFGGNVYHMDDFFLPPQMRTAERLATSGGNVHYERFYDEVVQGILSGKPFSFGVFDCSVGEITRQANMQPSHLHIVEGVYSAHPRYADVYTLRIFLEIDAETQKKRILARNGEKAEMFFTRWIPMENQYFKAFQIKENSDIVL